MKLTKLDADHGDFDIEDLVDPTTEAELLDYGLTRVEILAMRPAAVDLNLTTSAVADMNRFNPVTTRLSAHHSRKNKIIIINCIDADFQCSAVAIEVQTMRRFCQNKKYCPCPSSYDSAALGRYVISEGGALLRQELWSCVVYTWKP